MTVARRFERRLRFLIFVFPRNEKASVTAMFERETRREKILEARNKVQGVQKKHAIGCPEKKHDKGCPEKHGT